MKWNDCHSPIEVDGIKLWFNTSCIFQYYTVDLCVLSSYVVVPLIDTLNGHTQVVFTNFDGNRQTKKTLFCSCQSSFTNRKSKNWWNNTHLLSVARYNCHWKVRNWQAADWLSANKRQKKKKTDRPRRRKSGKRWQLWRHWRKNYRAIKNIPNGVLRVRLPFDGSPHSFVSECKNKKSGDLKNERDKFVVKKERDEQGKSAGVLQWRQWRQELRPGPAFSVACITRQCTRTRQTACKACWADPALFCTYLLSQQHWIQNGDGVCSLWFGGFFLILLILFATLLSWMTLSQKGVNVSSKVRHFFWWIHLFINQCIYLDVLTSNKKDMRIIITLFNVEFLTSLFKIQLLKNTLTKD